VHIKPAITQKSIIAQIRASLPQSVVLIAVLKNRATEEIRHALSAGITHIGENRMQEAEQHFKELRSAFAAVTKHFIGHLQSNKVRKAVQLFDIIQTVDSEKLAKKISAEAAKQGKIQQIMIQVNIGKEQTRQGVLPQRVHALYESIKALQNLKVIGLMCIPAALPSEQVRPFFKQMKQLQQQLNLSCLSMGMSDDYTIAIQEGSTMIRIGRKIFNV